MFSQTQVQQYITTQCGRVRDGGRVGIHMLQRHCHCVYTYWMRYSLFLYRRSCCLQLVHHIPVLHIPAMDLNRSWYVRSVLHRTPQSNPSKNSKRSSLHQLNTNDKRSKFHHSNNSIVKNEILHFFSHLYRCLATTKCVKNGAFENNS